MAVRREARVEAAQGGWWQSGRARSGAHSDNAVESRGRVALWGRPRTGRLTQRQRALEATQGAWVVERRRAYWQRGWRRAAARELDRDLAENGQDLVLDWDISQRSLPSVVDVAHSKEKHTIFTLFAVCHLESA